METKTIFKSKTAALGFLTALAGAGAFFFPEVEGYVRENSAGILFVLGLLSILLRRVTKGGVALFPLLLLSLCFSSLMLVSCNGVRMTDDGCVLACKDFANGQRACAGVCTDGRKIVEWDAAQLDGTEVRARATYRADGTYELSYRAGDVWVSYDPSAKNPLVIGPPPGEPGEAVPVDPEGK